MDGGLDPAHLVRNRPVIGVQAQPGPPRRDPQRLIRPHSRGHRAVCPQPRGHVGQLAPGDDKISLIRSPERHCRFIRRILRGGGPHDREHGVVGTDISGLDPEHEPHRLKELQQRPGGAGLHVRPHRGPVVGQRQLMLDVPVRGQDECLGGVAGCQLVQALRGDAVQPGQPVRPGNPDDAAM